MGQAYSSPWPDFLLYVSGRRPPASFDPSLAASYASPRTSAQRHDQPHVYLVAEQAYEALLSHQRSQAIMLTGESGSGKTQNARLSTEYLTRRSSDAAEARIGSLLSHADALLDAFGCADLGEGNTHASRFERETILHYSTGGRLVGATLNVFGLEEQRVACRSPTERNFNVFYQLLAGAPASSLHQLHLAPAARAAVSEDFAILRNKSHRAAHGALPAPEAAVRALHGPDTYLGLLPQALLRHCFTYAHSDAAGYAHTVAAMEALGISADEQRQIHQVLAALLLIGNVRDLDATQADTLAAAAELMGLTDYEVLLTTVAAQGTGGGETKLTGCDKLSGLLYGRLVTWLVARINAALGAPVTEACEALLDLRIVDPAGFCASRNTLTQMLYNYATDKLQATLLAHELDLQQRTYANVGLQWSRPLHADIPVVALFERSNGGLLPLLDGLSALTAINENAFFAELRSRVSNTALASPGASPGSFMARHTMGSVMYHMGGWLSQNRRTPDKLLSPSLLASSLSVVRGLSFSCGAGGVSGVCSGMQAIHAAASRGTVYTVLCIRSTRGDNSRSTFDAAAVSNQLGASLLDMTFATRFFVSLSFTEFLAQFGDSAAAPDRSDPDALERAVRGVLASVGLEASEAHLWAGSLHLKASKGSEQRS